MAWEPSPPVSRRSAFAGPASSAFRVVGILRGRVRAAPTLTTMTTRFLGVVAALAFVSVLAATAPAGAHHRPGHGTTTTSSTTTTSTSTTTTTESTTTTTAPTTTTTAPPVVTSEGDVAFHFWTKSATNFITDSPTEAMKQFMRDNYADALVFSPYWDSKLAWYPRGLEYTDVLGITESERTARPDLDAAILRDTNGSRVWIDSGCSGGVCARYAMDVGNATYRAYVLGELQDKVDRGYAGLWLDDVNLRIVGTFSDGTANITDVVNPDTGLVFTLQEWQERFVPILEQVRTTFPTQEIWHNAIWYIDQTTLTDPEVDRQIAAADGIMIEHGCNDGGLKGGTVDYGVRRLMQQVDRIHGLGADVVWNDESTSEAGWQRTPTQNEHNLACFLLTANGTDMVGSE